VGLDGSKEFVGHGAAPNPGAKFFIRIFLRWVLPARPISTVWFCKPLQLFHVPSKKLPRVLREHQRSHWRAGGVLFCSKPTGELTRKG